jgi:hypothetical protein
LELLSGILFLGVFAQVICCFIVERQLYNAIGLWAGIAIACFMVIHMKRSIEDVLDIGEEGAVKYARNAYIFRTIIALVVIGVVVIFKLGNPITLVIGIFPLKISAYIQPYIHKIFLWFSRKGG